MPVQATVPDAIEFLYSQVDSKGAASIKNDKDRAKLVSVYLKFNKFFSPSFSFALFFYI